MTMTIQSSGDRYFDVIEAKGYQVIVLGEIGEQWTDEVLSLFEREDVDIVFFPWSKSVDLRLQLETVYYPFIQLWRDGSLKAEFTGYHNEEIKTTIIEQIK